MEENLNTVERGEQGKVSDDVLVEAARAGSQAAFASLVENHAKKIYRRAYSITRNREDAEDAVQEVFLQAYVKLNQFEGRSMFYSWLTHIAINASLMALRRRARRNETSIEGNVDGYEDLVVYEIRDERPTPEEHHSVQQEYQWAIRAIQGLPLSLRSVAELRLVGEKAVEDTAQLLGVSEAAVKARLLRARRRLIARHR